MKPGAGLALATLFLLGLCVCAGAAAEEKAVLQWLGVAGWEIRLGRTTILIDPFLTRRSPARDPEWQTDEAAVLEVIKGADYILPGHSHSEHIADAPFLPTALGSE